jgi:NADPH:quinone reductase-like Zn-dependent oxidoreductase
VKAIRVEEHGGVEVLRLVDVPVPAPLPGTVAVQVRAIALNHLDLWVRRGVPGHRFPLPLVPGSDGAGIVTALGPGVTGLEVGQEVVSLPGVSCGRCAACLSGADQLCPGYGILGESRDGMAAEVVLLPAVNVQPKPAGLSFVEAAAAPLAFQTAWHMLVRRAAVQPGEWVLVQAGASGVGVAAIQIARLLGARVIATAGSAAKCARLHELGIEHVISYRDEDVAGRVKTITAKRGVEVVIDHVGEATFATSLRSLAWGGRYVTCGATTGPRADVQLNHLFFKSLSLLGSTMGSKGDLLRVFALLEQGRLRPVVGEVLRGLASIREAHARLEQRQVFGKIVLDLSGDLHD